MRPSGDVEIETVGSAKDEAIVALKQADAVTVNLSVSVIFREF